MAIRLPTGTRNALCDTAVDRADAGSGPATVEIRSGSQPATANDSATGDLLATLTLNDPAYGSASSGVAALSVSPALTTTGADDGTAGWFRIKDSSGTTVLDGSVTATGGGGDMTLATTAISTGVTVNITSGSVTMPAQ